MRKRNGFRASCLLLFCLGKPIGKEERWKVSKCQIEMFWLAAGMGLKILFRRAFWTRNPNGESGSNPPQNEQ